MRHIVERGTKRTMSVGKIVAIGANYTDHIEEMGLKVPDKPMIFLKPSSSILHSGEPIPYPKTGDVLHYEAELGLVVGEVAKDVTPEKGLGIFSHYLLALDMTLRDLQEEARERGWPWSTCKGFDGACPVSQAVPLGDPSVLADMPIRLSVNGEVRQDSTTFNMIWGPARLAEIVSSHFTLEPGDLILTGTPAGVGEVERRDTIEAGLGDELSVTFEIA
ncbi:MAG: acylpyruvase [Candidatus Eisenbacteria bacterium]|nr:acylpyruvase [Candidatus Eisenbacteria bacterium]